MSSRDAGCKWVWLLLEVEWLPTGRAEKLGLAISLVSKVPEKVWYCKQKGYKPWLDPKRKDIGTHEEGGHTIWYDEQHLLKVSRKENVFGKGSVLPSHRLSTAEAGQVAIRPKPGKPIYIRP